MAKRTKLKIDTRGPLQRAIDGERGQVIDKDGVAAYQDNAPLVNPHAAQHGAYVRNLRHIENQAVDVVERWKAADVLTPSQQIAITYCYTQWDAIGTSGSLVANLDRTVFGCPGDGHPREIDARENLARIKGYIPDKYFSVFENVCRFNEPAGVAGSRLGVPTQKQDYTARLIVQFVADIIFMKERLLR